MEKRVVLKWSAKSLNALQDIYDFYAEKSVDAANRIVNEIIETAETITFPEQYQRDEIMPQYRRMIVRHYKIIYHTEEYKIGLSQIHIVIARNEAISSLILRAVPKIQITSIK